MKKKYSSPVIRQTEIRPSTFMAGSAKGGYDSASIAIEDEETMSSRQHNWSFNDDDEY